MDDVELGESGISYTQPGEQAIKEKAGTRSPVRVGLLIDSFNQPR